MPSTTNKNMNSPNDSDTQPSSIGSSASTIPEEVKMSPEPEPEEGEPSQTMAVTPYAALPPISNRSHLHLEGSSLLTTSGHGYGIDISPSLLSAYPTHQQHTTGSFLFAQAALANGQLTYNPATVLAGRATPAGGYNGPEPIMPLSTANTIPMWIYDFFPNFPHLPPSFLIFHSSIAHATSLVWSLGLGQHGRERARPSFDAVANVDTLEEVGITTIDSNDMTCPHCHLPFGTTTVEDDPSILAHMNEMDRELTWRLEASSALPFCENKPNNDPVKTQYGHIFGKQCLIQSLEEVNKRCSKCRQEYGGTAAVPTGPTAPLE
ncbi:hypothetical protein G6011_06588 [Alternaria panax]|uniref:Uncharacterized protein n=1 Tax=Alternaria panax TaxID=48097 RepID=A0AAD4I5L7_9PLEO|nr:hypothetical protein G6011_06588 [Alternaria panax]